MNLTDIPNENNKTIELTKDELDKIQICDYTSLFSHLPISFQLNQNSQQLIYHPHFDLEFQQQATYKLCFASVCILFGFFFALCGYRFLKLSTFIVGFSLGSSIIYLILSEQKQLTLVENLIISLSIGVLFAFVALLVQYIGLFLIGITSSISLVTCILILIDLFHTNKSAWLCIGLLFVCATIVASITLKFQKSLTIINTSVIGSGLLLIAIDFFVENNLLIDYICELYRVNGHLFKIYERQNALLKPSSLLLSTLKTVTISTTAATTSGSSVLRSTTSLLSNRLNLTQNYGSGSSSITSSKALALFLHLYSSAHAKLCWYTWLIFSSFFMILIVSLCVQFLITGKNYDHRDSWQKLIRGNRRKKSANLEKIRLKSSLNEAENIRNNNYNQNNSNNNNNNDGNSSNLELVPTHHIRGKNRNKQNNDSMLLVEESSRTKNYKVTSSSSANENKKKANSKSNNKHSRPTTFETAAAGAAPVATNENFEIISFEIIKPNNKIKSKSKIKPEIIQNKNSTDAIVQSTSTTASTSSASSSSSSTCQLIPIKLNNNNINDTNPSLSTTTTNPSLSPRLPIKSQLVHNGSSLTPPPVPTLPPPKLPQLPPLLKTSNTTSTLNTASTNNNTLNINNSILPLQSGHMPNISKIKHHRNSVNNKDKDAAGNNSSEKFRHFYQARRNHGDALSQDFINNVQTKLSASNLINNNNNNNNNNNSNVINETNNLTNNNGHKSTSLTTSDKKKSKSSK